LNHIVGDVGNIGYLTALKPFLELSLPKPNKGFDSSQEMVLY
jgi:hypothetical protein